jgi:hypothetical protein
MPEVAQEFKLALLKEDLDLLVSNWILDRIPFPFGGDAPLYARWRQKLAGQIGVDPSEIKITGSAAFGVSLNPHKNYKSFDSRSDIDVAIISNHHFSLAWRSLRELGAKRHAFPPATKQAINDHVTKYIYWGTIATDKILHLLPFGKPWQQALKSMESTQPTQGISVNARIYRDFDSLRSYQKSTLAALRSQALSP